MRWVALCASTALLTAVASALVVWALSVPHRPLELVVAGSLATAIGLGGAFWFMLSRGVAGAGRRGQDQ